MLLTEFLWATACLAGLGLMGGFVVVPFRRMVRFPSLLAPAAGVLCLGLVTATAYSALGVSLKASVLVAFVVCMSLSLLAFASCWAELRASFNFWGGLAVLLATALGAVRAADATTIRMGVPAILYIDGTDHLGYAQVADWLAAHPVSQPPAYDASEPEQAYPALLFRNDPRFGSFFFLAVCSLIRGLPATFTYGLANAVALAAVAVGVTAAFARSRVTLVLLLASLCASQWYDLGQAGFFGKLIAYPAALILVGLYFAIPARPTPARLCAFATLSAGAAIMHSGLATALIFGAAAAAFLAGCAMNAVDRTEIRDRGLIAALAIGIVVVSTGMAARPAQIAFPGDDAAGWRVTLVRLLDLKTPWTAQQASANSLNVWIAVSACLWAIVLFVAVRRRCASAVGLGGGAAILCVVVSAAWGQNGAAQLVGVIYPLTACAAASLLDSLYPRSSQSPSHAPAAGVGVFAVCVALAALRAPRLWYSLHRYAGPHAPKWAQFSITESDRLAEAVGGRRVTVDLTTPQEVVFVLVELGRRDVHVQWSPRAWNVALGYTGWPAPGYPTAGAYRLVDRASANARNETPRIQTPHFNLLPADQ